MILDQAVATSLAIEEIGQEIVFDAPCNDVQSVCVLFQTVALRPYEQVLDDLLAGLCGRPLRHGNATRRGQALCAFARFEAACLFR